MTKWVPAPVVGGAYSDDTRPWSVQDTVNYIPVAAERPGTRSLRMLRGAPGLVPFADLGTGAPIRGMRNVEGLLLAVSGNKLFKVSPTAAVTNLGTIPGVSRVSMAHNQITNGNQVAIANGVGGYVYNTVTGVLGPITDEGFPGSVSFDYADSYITGIEPGRRFAFTSELADATSYNTLDRYEAEGSPDLLIGQIVTHREWWLFGQRTVEPYQNTGASTGTWQRASGTVLEVGAASPYAIVNLDNSVFWLSGDGIVYRANGYTPVRVSTQPIEQAIANCDLSKAFAFTYEDRGHKIFYLTFQDGKTWGYDVLTQEWHRRKSKNLDRWRINALVQWNGMWIAGDYQNGKLYRLDWDVANEDGQTLERRRITGVLHDNQNGVIVNGIALVFDTGQPSPIIPAIQLHIYGDAPSGVLDVPYTHTFPVTGGIGPYVFSITSGGLPGGITLDTSTGTISGTPTDVETASFTITVTSSDGQTASLPQTIGIVEATYQNQVLSDVPLIYLPLNEESGTVATDLSGNGYHGTYVGGYVHDATALRPAGRSMLVGETAFTAGMVTVPDDTYRSAFAEDHWTVECIFKFVGQRGVTNNYVCSKMSNTASGLGTFNMFVAINSPFNTTVKTSGAISGQEVGIQDAADLDDVHIATMVKDGDDFTLYVDGAFVQTIPGATFVSFSNAAPICIGGNNVETIAYQFHGYISDFSLYGSALSADRILAHAQSAGLA